RMTRHAHDPGPWSLHPQLATDSHPLATLELSELRLMDDANYPWLVLVPRVAGARELIDLEPAQRRQLTDEIDLACRQLSDPVRRCMLNVTRYGDLAAQREVRALARIEDDAAWPAPVWGRGAGRPYTPEALVCRVRVLDAALRGQP